LWFSELRKQARETACARPIVTVRLYHPDKVSHLGAELRQLAEEKTKMFNSAFKVLQDFYDTEMGEE
jgi:hypothetical protein